MNSLALVVGAAAIVGFLIVGEPVTAAGIAVGVIILLATDRL